MIRLSDLSDSGYTVLGIVGLLLAVAGFAAVLVWTCRRSRREIEQWARQPLDDAPPAGR